MRAFLSTTLAVVVLWCAPAFAHTPENCAPLFQNAAAKNDAIVKMGKRASDAGLDMLDSRVGSHRDRYRRYDSGRVERFADLVAQFQGNLEGFHLAITDAVKCVDGRK